MNELGVKLNLSTAFHPQTDEQSERTIQTLEDMLRSCERKLLGPKIVQATVDKVNIIRAKLKAAQDRQKSYADVRRKDLEFEVGDRVFLKLSPWKGVLRFGKRGKLSPRYIGPYEIVERIDPVAYRIDLPEELSRVHNVFHISILRKHILDPSHVLETPEFELWDDLSYEEQPVQILGREEKRLRNKTIALVKVLWINHLVEEATWEREDQMRSQYPYLFQNQGTGTETGGEPAGEQS
nr:uncharacterized protein LOC125420984 [Ziziphus jujuba var. spinosa]